MNSQRYCSGEDFTKPKILFGKGLQKHLSRLQRRPLKRRALSLKRKEHR
ncbi:hypothetical protein NC653_006538 [Populus alba x Populus x berolinensis]|uniref:Uncharacterized protein n=1 Tax=Populus alba x Populus x berolinensis TaxID=444605 RepID=A0AAD6REV1_9ROSI|nr:hypothetical protein NC653_006538 [Populus alba x Populus x berolinensis]